MKKKLIFLEKFSPLELNFLNLFFFLFLIANSAKFKMQKEKSQKFCFDTIKMAAKSSLVILFALVIYTAPTGCSSKPLQEKKSILSCMYIPTKATSMLKSFRDIESSRRAGDILENIGSKFRSFL